MAQLTCSKCLETYAIGTQCAACGPVPPADPGRMEMIVIAQGTATSPATTQATAVASELTLQFLIQAMQDHDDLIAGSEEQPDASDHHQELTAILQTGGPVQVHLVAIGWPLMFACRKRCVSLYADAQ